MKEVFTKHLHCLTSTLPLLTKYARSISIVQHIPNYFHEDICYLQLQRLYDIAEKIIKIVKTFFLQWLVNILNPI